MENPSVEGYVLLSPEGIPIRYHDSIPYETAILYASLMSDFNLRARNSMLDLIGASPDSEVVDFRFRTDQGRELIVTVSGDYLLVVVQRCALPTGPASESVPTSN